MATEILSVPEEHLQDVIYIIRVGLMYTKSNTDLEVRQQLRKWCDEEEKYLNGGEK